MISLTYHENKFYIKQKFLLYMQKYWWWKFSTDDESKKHHKVRDRCHHTEKYRTTAHSICNLRHKPLKEIPAIFQNDSTYDYHFIIKELAEKFEGKFEFLGENAEK